MDGVSVAKIAKKMELKNFIEEIDLKEKRILLSDVNRPALQLSGYFEYFDPSRVEIIGMVEYAYLQKKTEEERQKIYDEFLSYDIPCVIFCREFEPDAKFLETAKNNGVPVLGTEQATSEFMAGIINILTEELAPCVTIHGVLVDVYGEGLLIMGESGIGKSEAALELVKRGHRLVTDDVVEIRKINDHTLIGTSPDITR